MTDKAKYNRTHLRRPAPSDLLETLLAVTWVAAAKHYGAGNSTLANWIKRMSPEDRAAVAEAGRQRKAYSDERRSAIAKAKAATKAATNRGKPPALWTGSFNKSYTPQVPSRTVDMAVTHLRKAGFVPVFDAGKVENRPGEFVAGRLRLTEAELLALAAKHGYNPNAWRQVAA